MWSNKFGEAWKRRDVDALMSLFAKEGITYYENSLLEPVKNWELIKDLWDEVPNNQKDISYWSEILSSTNDRTIINWKVSRTLVPSGIRQEIDGIFDVKFDKHGLCNYFNQWRTVKTTQS